MSLRSHSHVKASMVLTRADHLFIHNYIRSLINIIVRPILLVRTGLEPAYYCACVCRHRGSFIYIIHLYKFNRYYIVKYMCVSMHMYLCMSECVYILLYLYIYAYV